MLRRYAGASRVGSGGGGRFVSGPGSELKETEPAGDLVVGVRGLEVELAGSCAVEGFRLKSPMEEGWQKF